MSRLRRFLAKVLRRATPPPQSTEWSSMMERAQGGDAAAYRSLLTDVAALVRCWSDRQGVEEAAREALVTNVLLSLHGVRHTYDPSRPFVPWLLAVIRAEARKEGQLKRSTSFDLAECAESIGRANEGASGVARSIAA